MISSIYKDEAHHFRVWAPEKEEVQLHVVIPFDRQYQMQKDNEGYFSAVVPTREKILRYFFKPDGKKDVPDPASPFQPEGVHGPSQTVDHA
jgi:maltooligosyltrehalose trehalohydrolase